MGKTQKSIFTLPLITILTLLIICFWLLLPFLNRDYQCKPLRVSYLQSPPWLHRPEKHWVMGDSKTVRSVSVLVTVLPTCCVFCRSIPPTKLAIDVLMPPFGMCGNNLTFLYLHADNPTFAFNMPPPLLDLLFPTNEFLDHQQFSRI